MQVGRVVELHLVGDEAGGVALVGRVLQGPAAQRLLHKLADGLGVGGPPDLQVLGGVASLVLAWALPRAQEGALGREGQLVDVDDGQDGNRAGVGGPDDRHDIRGGPGKVAAAGGVGRAPQVPLGAGEAGQGLVGGRGLEDADGLLGAIGKLQRSHD